jgi:hypothetical protein
MQPQALSDTLHAELCLSPPTGILLARLIAQTSFHWQHPPLSASDLLLLMCCYSLRGSLLATAEFQSVALSSLEHCVTQSRMGDLSSILSELSFCFPDACQWLFDVSLNQWGGIQGEIRDLAPIENASVKLLCSLVWCNQETCQSCMSRLIDLIHGESFHSVRCFPLSSLCLLSFR